MHVLVTGGAGYVGNLLTAALLERGHEVTIIDNFLYGHEPILHLVNRRNLTIIKGDIRNENASYLKHQDVVFHLAAISGYPACEANPHSAQRINVEATQRIAEALAPDQLLVYASTTSLYGGAAAQRLRRTGRARASDRRYDWRETVHREVDDFSQAYVPHLDRWRSSGESPPKPAAP